MLRIFVGIFVISFFSAGATSPMPRTFIDIQKLLNGTMEKYQEGHQYKNLNMAKENVEQILEEVVALSSELYTLDTDMEMKCGDMLNSLLADQLLRVDLQSSIQDLCNSIKVVNHFFEESTEYTVDGLFSNQTFQNFAYEALWGDINIPDTLEDIHESFISSIFGPGLLTLILQRSEQNHQAACDTHVSTQQQVYYIYIQLIMSELKSLIITQRIYLTKRIFNENSDNYIAELKYSARNFNTRMNEYYQKFSRLMDLFPQYIHRCDVKQPERGVNFIELEKFSRFKFLDSTLEKNYPCRSCPSVSQTETISVDTRTTIYNCTNYGVNVLLCPAVPGSHRDYLWFRDTSGTLYGENTTCDRMEGIQRGQYSYTKWSHYSLPVICIACGCSMDQNETQQDDNSTIWRISVTGQTSDIQNNMVVTGVKFVTYNNALHLQIQQANFSHSGMIHNDSAWKELDIGLSDRGLTPTKVKMYYEPLRYNRKSLYLDDIRVPEGTVVTGVKFSPAGDSAFKLQILASSFDFETGVVFPFGSTWVDASTNPMRSEYYKRQRIEINLDNSDDPTKAVQFKYEPESNKLIEFTHTDIHKDAGQTTIPLLDAQPVQTQPPFPLGGIGLSFRGKDGFGGYIAPRIYTVDVANYLNSLNSSSNGQQLDTEAPAILEEDHLDLD